MKTILTFVGGGERDHVILQTALAAALPLSAHVDCLHAHVPSDQAAPYANLDFAMGDALKSALDSLGAKADSFAQLAARNVQTYCDKAGIQLRDAPPDAREVTASFLVEPSNDLPCLTAHAARHDLIVMGRAKQKQGLAPTTLEHFLRHSGRPVLTAGKDAPTTLSDTIMVCWKDAHSTGAAVKEAAPLLAKARRVVFTTIAKRDGGLSATMTASAQELAGIKAEARVLPPRGNDLPGALAAAAKECGANLLVMGAYGRSRSRQFLFGSHTDLILAQSDLPILLRHG